MFIQVTDTDGDDMLIPVDGIAAVIAGLKETNILMKEDCQVTIQGKKCFCYVVKDHIGSIAAKLERRGGRYEHN